ncbi:hypothetical protein [Planomonospora sp. ID82291]|uniref:hypothetical protein n=1 Tax=Planomonospora sp. ID82291 TaxID=2738136 RepID=UPI0018C443BD|nr:hypothetical protein [Planomonospora sp. ID82291]MBG0812653.1 hypothetical protein [Planomonospora sp. ID82291]
MRTLADRPQEITGAGSGLHLAGGHLVVTLPPGRHRVRLPLSGPDRVVTLMLYGHPGPYGTVHGLAILDDRGRVMLDSPGPRPREAVEAVAAEGGLTFAFRLYRTAEKARLALARRAPAVHPESAVSPPFAEAIEVRPAAGAVKGAPLPATVLSWDGETMVAVDLPADRSVRLTPAALYHYRHGMAATDSRGKTETQVFTGLAVLDADGLVLLDLPGEWRIPDVAAFAAGAGLPVVDALDAPSDRVRAVLAGRAPGWRRLAGLPVARRSGAKRVVVVGAGAAGLLTMAYVVSVGGTAAWRGLSALGWMLLDVVDAKWFAVFFSPLLLVLAPARQALHVRQVRRGKVLGQPGGPRLSVRNGMLRIMRAPKAVPLDLLLGPGPGTAACLLAYRYEGVRGLFVLSGAGAPLNHLPGPWHPEDVHRFAVRHGLAFEGRTLNREEYLDLASRVRDALP